MDLTDLGSVRRAAARISDVVDSFDLFVAVAGVMATPQRTVGPGWESQLAANHFGHFTLACELYPRLAAADGARVVVNSSAAHALTDIRWNDPHFRTGYDKWLAYGQAKSANSLFAVHLDTLGADDGVRAFTLHTGKIITGLQREMTRAEQVERGWVDEQGNVIGSDFKTAAQGPLPDCGLRRLGYSTGVEASTWRTATSREYLLRMRRWTMGRSRIRHRSRRRRAAMGAVDRGDRRNTNHPIVMRSILCVALKRSRDNVFAMSG